MRMQVERGDTIGAGNGETDKNSGLATSPIGMFELYMQ